MTRNVYEFMGKKVRASMDPAKLLEYAGRAARMRESSLTSLESQEAYILRLQLERSPCIHPDCDAKLSQLEAFTGEIFDLGAVKESFACPACGTPMKVIVPLMGPSWFWAKVPK